MSLTYEVSFVLQVIALAMTFYIKKFTKEPLGWFLIVAALVVILIRRALGLYNFYGAQIDLAAISQWTSFITSVLIIGGVYFTANFFEKRYKDEKEFVLNREKLESIITLSEDAIITKTLGGTIQSWNPAAERIFGYKENEAVGQHILMLIPKERYQEEDLILSNIAQGKRVAQFETERIRKDGKRIFLSVTSSPIKDQNNHIVGASTIARDITIKKLHDEAIKNSEANYKALAEQKSHLFEREKAARLQIEEATRIKDQFLATLSHELRTPLNAILGWSQLTARRIGDPPKLKEGLAVIERSARSQAQIIEDLLDMNRIISGTLRLDRRMVNILDILNEAIETILPAVEAKSISLERVLEDSTPNFYGDPNRLKQIIWNILTNAVKFTDKGGKIRIVLKSTDTQIAIIVSDSGRGIKANFLPHVFDRFSQADATASRQYGGLGLGLSIVKHLVEIHGGHIEVDSEGEGKGATFSVSLPAASAFKPARSIHQPENVMERNEVLLCGVKALVVDDEDDSRNLVKALLEDNGAHVLTASSSKDAMELLRVSDINLIVSDIGMPNEDGYEFMRRVRNLDNKGNKAVPAIALTAYARSEDRMQALESGFQMHIAKPVEPAYLLSAVSSLTRQQ